MTLNTDSVKSLILEALIDLGKIKSSDIPESYIRITDLMDDAHKSSLVEEEVTIP